MKTRKPKFEKPITGVGPVKVAERSFTIDLTYKDEKGREQEDKFTFKLADLPEELPDGWQPKSGKAYFASISADGGTLLNIRPAKGTFTVRCIDFSQKDGEYLVIARTGDYGPYSQFVPLLTVRDGDNEGIQYPLYLPYSSGDKARLVCGDGGLMEVVGDPEKSKAIASLFDFLEYTGVIEQDIEYPTDDDGEPNDDPQEVLDTLFRAVKKAKRDFTLLVENGYPKAMSEAEDVETESEPDDEPEEKPAKKSTKATEPDEEVEEKPKKKKPNWD